MAHPVSRVLHACVRTYLYVLRIRLTRSVSLGAVSISPDKEVSRQRGLPTKCSPTNENFHVGGRSTVSPIRISDFKLATRDFYRVRRTSHDIGNWLARDSIETLISMFSTLISMAGNLHRKCLRRNGHVLCPFSVVELTPMIVRYVFMK